MLKNNHGGVVKLIDFGLSRKILPGAEVNIDRGFRLISP